VRIGRRALLRTWAVGSPLVFVLSGCGQAAERARPTSTAAAIPEMDRWRQEALGILTDTRTTLRTFDTYHAFRSSTASSSSLTLPSELVWDPPTGAAWDEATHVTRGVRGRSEQLFLAVTTARIDPSAWREQRTAADAAHELLDLADMLGAYRGRLDVTGPGDASQALGLLDRAWAQWDTAAARWGLSRAESIGCGSPSRL
jgi:hypothetical protein